MLSGADSEREACLSDSDLDNRLRMIECKLEMLRWMGRATIAALESPHDCNPRDVLAAAVADLRTQGKSDAAFLLEGEIESIGKLLINPDFSPAQALLIMALARHDAGPNAGAALEDWLRTGTDEEIAEDLRDLFAKLFSSRPD